MLELCVASPTSFNYLVNQIECCPQVSTAAEETAFSLVRRSCAYNGTMFRLSSFIGHGTLGEPSRATRLAHGHTPNHIIMLAHGHLPAVVVGQTHMVLPKIPNNNSN